MTNQVSNLIGLPLAALLLAVISLPLMKRLATQPARRIPLLGRNRHYSIDRASTVISGRDAFVDWRPDARPADRRRRR